jgi:magnesium-transporting ATPase (P-type)
MEHGLTNQQAQTALEQYGKNSITTSHTASSLKIFLSQFATVINAILVIAEHD